MSDKITRAQRSYNMSRIRGTNTKPELKLKKSLTVLGFSYQPKRILGKPDFANKKEKIAIFIDGCFWHKCPADFVAPAVRKTFWKNKISKNVIRDRDVTKKLKESGWVVIRIWEHEIKENSEHCISLIGRSLGKRTKSSSDPK